MDYLKKLGLEMYARAHEVPYPDESELEFLGLVAFLARDSKIARVQPIRGATSILIVLKEEMTSAGIERMLKGHAFPQPISEIRATLNPHYNFRISGHTYTLHFEMPTKVPSG